MKYRGVVGFALVAAMVASPHAISESKKEAVELSDMIQPEYTSEGHLILPTGYRTWIFVGSSMGLSYFGKEAPEGPGVFHHIYIQPEAYRHYIEPGEFPDKTILDREHDSAGSEENNTPGGPPGGRGAAAGVAVGIRCSPFWTSTRARAGSRWACRARKLPSGDQTIRQPAIRGR